MTLVMGVWKGNIDQTTDAFIQIMSTLNLELP